MSRFFGYHRISADKEYPDRDIYDIEQFCKLNHYELTQIYVEREKGINIHRPRYIVLKEDMLKKGDTLIIAKVNNLGQSKYEILQELKYFKEQMIRLVVLEIPETTVDYSELGAELSQIVEDAIQNTLIQTYGCSVVEKYNEGEASKCGRPAIVSKEQFLQEYQLVKDGEVTPTQLMRMLGLKSSTYYNYKKKYLL